MTSSRKAVWLLLVLSTQYSVLSTFAHAHPVPQRVHDRVLTVRLGADAVTVDYHLELDELTAYEELPAVAEPADLARVTRANFYDTFTRLYAPVLAGNLTATLDGKPLEFRCVRRHAELKDSVWCDFVFRAPWQPAPDDRHAFSFYEGNYEEEAGQLKLALSADRPVRLAETTQPDEALKHRAPTDLRPGDAPRLRKASATFTVGSAADAAAEAPPAESDNPAPVARSNNLVGLLLDTRQGFVILLLLAAGLGAAHALTPGHGKTLVASYLVGERGTVWHALLLGVATTLTHTGVVLALAAGLRFAPRNALEPIQSVLGLVGGLTIVAVGLWLLFRRLSGRADHVHLGGHGHHHHHGDHDHEHGDADHYQGEHGHAHPLPAGGERASWWSVTLLGISGGLVPCVDAIIMLIYAISAGLLWLALPLLLAFSGGLAAVLIVLGIAVVSAKGMAEARLGKGRLRRMFRVLPILSAVVVIGLGFWLCRESLNPEPPTAHSQSQP
jgi:ABC-type nickel/cobalt efflux system permease component RcnA